MPLIVHVRVRGYDFLRIATILSFAYHIAARCHDAIMNYSGLFVTVRAKSLSFANEVRRRLSVYDVCTMRSIVQPPF
jgi:hypothetical protein